MATVANLLAKLELDSSDFNRGIDSAQAKAGLLSTGLTGLGNVGAAAVGIGLGAAAAGAVGLGIGLTASVKAAMEAQDVQAQLDAVLKSTGGQAGVTKDQVNSLADSLSKFTKFDDEAIVSAESLMLTFTSVSKDIFPGAIETALDMSQALGQDLQGSVVQLGKALQDPTKGITALRRVGVNFTEDQEKLIKTLVETGRLEEAQGLILQELQKEFGGSAIAAGQTFGGQLTILKTALGNVLESVGGKLLPILTQFATTLNNYIAKPETQAFIVALGQGIADFAQKVVTALPGVITNLQNAFGWLSTHQGVIVAALAIIGASILAFVFTTVIPALVSFYVAAAPVILVMALIGGAAYLLYQAWTTNFGGIQEKVAAVWAFLQPVFQSVVAWLKTNIPVAIAALSDFWTSKLLPAITTVWNWISTNLIPLFRSIGTLIGVVLKKDLEAWTLIWQTRLLPALTAVWDFITTNLFPIFRSVGEFVGTRLVAWFKSLTDTIQKLTTWIGNLAEGFSSLSLPAWLTPGSPTPLELGLIGVTDATKQLVRSGLPEFMGGGFGSGSLALGGAGAAAPIINIYVTSDGVTDDADVARKIAGAIDIRLRERNLA